MKEKRKLKRRHLIFFLRIFETTHDRLIGYLVDVTTQGIKIMSEEPIKVGCLHRFKILIDAWDENNKFLYFDAYSRWSQQNLKTDFYDTGFELMNMSPENLKAIEKIIDELGLNEQGDC